MRKVPPRGQGLLAGSHHPLQTKFKTLHPKTLEQRLLEVYSGFRQKKKALFGKEMPCEKALR